MRIGPRLWLTGALLPMAVLALALVAAVAVFRRALEGQLDRGLLAQAAVEEVSLFDGPGGSPHLHMERSSMLAEVQPFAPIAVVYGPAGERVLGFPADASGPSRLDERPPLRPRLWTEEEGGGQRSRVLLVAVDAPDGSSYALRLSASLAQIDAAVGLLRRVGLGLVAGFGALLVLVQGLSARRMSRRLGALERHMERVGRGELDAAPSSDGGDDEISRVSDAIAAATSELAASRRARERLVADAAHELKTPLANMHTAIDVALRRERDAASLRATLEDAREEVDRLAHLSSHLLELSALSTAPLRRAAVDVCSVLRDAAGSFAAGAEARGVRIEVSGDSEIVDADAGGLRQAVDNLLSNALKFAPAGSRVALSARRSGARVVIEVADEGPGVDASERESIFEPFHRARNAPPGAGLGLAIVREVAERHGGRAFVVPGGAGARFVLELPA